MEPSKRPVADRQWRSDKRGGRRWLRWLCNASVWKSAIALAKLIYQFLRLVCEIVRWFSKH